MATVSQVKYSSDAPTSLAYIVDKPLYKSEKLYEIWTQVPEGAQTTNCEFESRSVLIVDARQSTENFDYDTTGFKWLQSPTASLPTAEDFAPGVKSATIESYLKETIDLVKSEFAADQVICFDYRVRS
jgi:hypothetical protein